VLYVATPPLSVAVPRDVVPSVKITVPVAVAGMTVAVNVTGDPYADGFGDEASVTVVVTGFTVNDTAPVAAV